MAVEVLTIEQEAPTCEVQGLVNNDIGRNVYKLYRLEGQDKERWTCAIRQQFVESLYSQVNYPRRGPEDEKSGRLYNQEKPCIATMFKAKAYLPLVAYGYNTDRK